MNLPSWVIATLEFIWTILCKLFWIIFSILLIIQIALQFENFYIKPEIQKFFLDGSLIIGISLIIFKEEDKYKSKQSRSIQKYAFKFGFLIIFAWLIYLKLQENGLAHNAWISIPILVLSSYILIAFLNFDSEKQNSKEVSDFCLNQTSIISLGIVLLCLGIGYFTGITLLRILFTGVFTLFMGGFFWTYVFFDYQDINKFERVTLSTLFSLIALPLCILFLNRIGMPVTPFSVMSTNILICLSGLFLFKNKHKFHSHFARCRRKIEHISPKSQR